MVCVRASCASGGGGDGGGGSHRTQRGKQYTSTTLKQGRKVAPIHFEPLGALSLAA